MRQCASVIRSLFEHEELDTSRRPPTSKGWTGTSEWRKKEGGQAMRGGYRHRATCKGAPPRLIPGKGSTPCSPRQT